MGRRDGRRKRSRSRSLSRSRTRRRSRERRDRRSRSRSGTRKRRYRSRSRSSSSSDRGRGRRRQFRSHRSRHTSSSSNDSSQSSSPDRRGRASRSGRSSKAESRSSSPDSHVKMSGLARNQALITAMLSKTDDKYRAAEARNKPQAAPVSSVLASLESDEFVPQSFVSHRTRADSDEALTTEQEKGDGNQDNHDAAIFGGSDTKLPVTMETTSVLEGPTAKPKQLDALSESERLQLWLNRLRSLRELYGPPPAAPPPGQ